MGRVVNIKVKASSVVEVTIAMVIASLSFVLAAIFFGQLTVSSLYRQPAKAQQLAESYLNQSLLDKAYLTETLEHETYQIQRTVSTYQASPLLLVVHIEVLSADYERLAEAKQLVYVEELR